MDPWIPSCSGLAASTGSTPSSRQITSRYRALRFMLVLSVSEIVRQV
jgi:hypothetical protein